MLKRMRPRKRLVTGMMKMRTGGLTGPLKEGPNSPEKLVVVKHNEYFGYAKQYRRLYYLTRLCEMEPGQDPAILSTRRTGAIAKEEAPPKRMGGAEGRVNRAARSVTSSRNRDRNLTYVHGCTRQWIVVEVQNQRPIIGR
jgi:hypothetical protein